jgi:hypothetical protein
LVAEASILLAASRGNSTAILKETAATYKVDTDTITAKVRQEFSAKEKTKKAAQSTNQPSRAPRKQPKVGLPRGGEPAAHPFLCLQNRAERTRFDSSLHPHPAASLRSPVARQGPSSSSCTFP